MKDKIIAITIVIILIVFGVWYAFYYKPIPQNPTNAGDKTVIFACDAGKSITATFHLPEDADVTVALSDGRTLTLPHTVSADGARYASADESFVFWNKGNTAFVTESTATNSTNTFANCVEQTPPDTSGMSTYTNDQYGFQIKYPEALTPTTVFINSYTLQNEWRIGAGVDSPGMPVIAIPVFHIDQGGIATGKPYPLFFDSEVRIGVSSNSTDVANCLKPDPNYTNQPQADVVVNGVPFKKFSFQDAATMKYVQGESYRAIHNNMCFAVEQIKTGSSYRDPTMTEGISDAQLNVYYDQAGQILQTFQFTK